MHPTSPSLTELGSKSLEKKSPARQTEAVVNMTESLLARQIPLAQPQEQVRILNQTTTRPSFEDTIRTMGLQPLQASGIATLQINVGKLCNQTCRHCHVDAGPDRSEQMSRDTAESCIHALASTDIPTVDLTGGAPELNPQFRWLVQQAHTLGRHVMDRCNLSVLLLPSQSDLGRFLADHQVEVIASLPYFRSSQTDTQRGTGVFDKSIEGLTLLNSLGYGQPDSGLLLNLVYNPVGAFLPPKQETLETQFKKELYRLHGISFNRLYAITNMPISRFLEFLIESGNYEGYMERLVHAFNPAALDGVMCRSTLSVGWDGRLFDCDFNQMLDLPLTPAAPQHIKDFTSTHLSTRQITTGNHCYGCVAGTGSSCGGSVA